MSYLLDKKTKRKKFWIAAWGALFLVVLFYFRAGIWGGLSYLAQEIFNPVLVTGNDTGGRFKNLGAYFISKKLLGEENKILLSKLTEAEAKMLNYETLAIENATLKEILERKKEETPMLLSAILSKPNQNAYDTLLVDAGTEKGVKTGDIVFALGNIPIGRVENVTPNSSKIILFSSPGERTPSVISRNIPPEAGSKSTFFELVGRGGGNFEMVLPRDMALQAGDRAIMPGLYPYVLALVETTISDPRDPFTKMLFVSPVNIQELEFVQIKNSGL